MASLGGRRRVETTSAMASLGDRRRVEKTSVMASGDREAAEEPPRE